MKSLKLRWAVGTTLALLFLTFAANSNATSIMHMNLAQLTKNAGRIFIGECISVSDATISGPGGGNIAVTVYTFSVSKTIKGSVGQTITVKQLGRRTPDYARGRNFAIPGMPVYKMGEKFVLLLTEESRLGLTVPVGLTQGCFQIYTSRTGRTEVMNGMANAGLFNGMTGSLNRFKAAEAQLVAKNKGAIEYEAFVNLLEKIAQ